MAARRNSPRLLKKVKKNPSLHLERLPPLPKKKELTKREQIFKMVTDLCEEGYLLTDSECGTSLIDSIDCVTEIEGVENGYLLKYRMDIGKEFATRQLAIRLSKALNCPRRYFCRRDSVTYPGVIRPMFYLECAMVLEDNRGIEEIDRSGEEDDDEFLFRREKRKEHGRRNIEGEKFYDGTQSEEAVEEMLEESEVVLTEESYAEADEAYANFA